MSAGVIQPGMQKKLDDMVQAERKKAEALA